jgi:hypothetical protein
MSAFAAAVGGRADISQWWPTLAIYEYTSFCNGPVDVNCSPIVTPLDEVQKLRQRFHVSKLAFGWGICEPCFGTRAMFQEDKDMADQNEAKTKTIGFLPLEKVQTLKGWEEYLNKSTKLSALRTDLLQALPERVFNADPRALDDRRFHGSSPPTKRR